MQKLRLPYSKPTILLIAVNKGKETNIYETQLQKNHPCRLRLFLISAFWQAYDAIVPLILTNHFGLPQTASGAVMSLDNILAVFMLPIFGAISDKVNTKYGKRTPFILFGTIVATVSFVALTFIDNYQLAKVVSAGIPEMQQGALSSEEFSALVRETTVKLTLDNPLPLIGFIATPFPSASLSQEQLTKKHT